MAFKLQMPVNHPVETTQHQMMLCGFFCVIHQRLYEHTYPPMKMEQTEHSETLAFKLQTLVNHPEESILHSEHGVSFNN
jgi:hypothetical protein